ncbi:CU044_5270 family protein [Streptomyces sp. 4N509B]|uniref:CU044_5270 family protein n=1 Tax=Streptomyces sp. 4N509B TaxID=3457413 RepID=UPI003FD33788
MNSAPKPSSTPEPSSKPAPAPASAPSSEERADADVARLLTLLPDPAPGEAGMAPGRQAHLRTALRAEYRRLTPPEGARSRSRRRTTWILAPTAAACALAITVGLTSLGTDGTGGTDGANGPGGAGGETPGIGQPATPTAAHLLHQAARSVARSPQGPPRDDQYTYAAITGFTHVQVGDGSSFTTEREETRGELWTSVDGSAPSLEREDDGDRWTPAPAEPSLSQPTYRLLESLPTDPEVLLDQIYAEAERRHEEGGEGRFDRDQGAFELIGTLLSIGPLPPQTAATLYRAAADIPGVILLPDAEDALGREGVAVARERDGWRHEWLFDEDTTRLLGLRTVLTEPSEFGEAGTVYDSLAISRVGVVDEAGEIPRGAAPDSGTGTGA